MNEDESQISITDSIAGVNLDAFNDLNIINHIIEECSSIADMQKYADRLETIIKRHNDYKKKINTGGLIYAEYSPTVYAAELSKLVDDLADYKDIVFLIENKANLTITDNGDEDIKQYLKLVKKMDTISYLVPNNVDISKAYFNLTIKAMIICASRGNYDLVNKFSQDIAINECFKEELNEYTKFYLQETFAGENLKYTIDKLVQKISLNKDTCEVPSTAKTTPETIFHTLRRRLADLKHQIDRQNPENDVKFNIDLANLPSINLESIQFAIKDIVLPSKDEVCGKGTNEISAFFNYNSPASVITDFAIITGAMEDTTNRLFELKNDTKYLTPYGMYWLSTPHDNSTAYIIDSSGKLSYADFDKKYCSLRPLLIFSYISGLNDIDKETTPFIKITYGEYPQVVSDFEAYNINANFTGKTYTVNSQNIMERDNTLKTREYAEFEYHGKKYIRAIANLSSSAVLSNDQSVNQNNYVFIEVEPITWILDVKNNVAIAEKSLVSGIDFKQINEFMQRYFKNDIVTSDSMKEFATSQSSKPCLKH